MLEAENEVGIPLCTDIAHLSHRYGNTIGIGLMGLAYRMWMACFDRILVLCYLLANGSISHIV